MGPVSLVATCGIDKEQTRGDDWLVDKPRSRILEYEDHRVRQIKVKLQY